MRRAKSFFLPSLVAWGIVSFLFVSPLTFATDIGCGRDTDRNGSVDTLCIGSDQDNDGYTEAQGDCDDTDWQIFPGTPSTKGLSAGHYRVCKADGSGWTADTTSSVTPYCPSGDYTTTSGKSATTCYYFDQASGNDSTGNGSWANPWKTPNKISYNNGSKYTAQAGDAFIFKSGTYTETAQVDAPNDRVLFFWAAGTSSNHIWIIGYPGTKPIFQGAIDFYDVGYTHLWNIEITQGSLDSQGLIARGVSTNVDVALMYIHDKQGVKANNMACIQFTQGGDNSYIHHNFVSDCDDPDAAQPSGHSIYVGQQDSGERVEYNNMINSDDGHTEHCIYEKHLRYASSGILKNNYCQNSTTLVGSSGGQNRTIQNNLAVNCDTGIELYNSAGPTFFGGTLIENNTFICNYAVNTKPAHSHNTDGTTTGVVNETCGGNDPTWEVSTYRYNILSSTLSNFEAQLHGVYKADEMYTLWHTNGAWNTHHNGYYSSGSSTLKMGMFSDNNGCGTTCCNSGSLGTTWSTLATIQANGYEAGSVQADPQLAANTYLSSNSSMDGWGYFVADGGGGNPIASTVSRASKRRRF